MPESGQVLFNDVWKVNSKDTLKNLCKICNKEQSKSACKQGSKELVEKFGRKVATNEVRRCKKVAIYFSRMCAKSYQCTTLKVCTKYQKGKNLCKKRVRKRLEGLGKKAGN